MQVIGIVGLAGSGKSTVARRLIERHGFQPGKFARSLKLMLRTMLLYRGAATSEIERMIEGDLKEVPSSWLNGKTPRHAMQTLGTEWGRECIGSDFWVDTEGDHLGMHPGAPKGIQPGSVVFDDVRFENEVAFIRAMGGQIWQIRRDFQPLDRRAVVHVSETLSVVPDNRIHNTGGGVAMLNAMVDMAIVAQARSLERAVLAAKAKAGAA